MAPGAWAHGGPPMRTDIPESHGDGKWEINLAYLEARPAGERLRRLPHVDLNYGMSDRTQLKYETGWAVRTTDPNGTQRGVDNSLFGVKARFFDQTSAGVNVSTSS